MKASDLKRKYLDFFVKKNHKILPNVSLVPENDSTALFINSGMHPLVPYLLGEPHPLGKRLTSNQRCLRTQDIESIGDNSHLTFFEMLGNWSLGDYWKKEAISWSWEFLTKELNLDEKRISVSCFLGDKDLPKDEESAKIWQSLGVPPERIYFLGKQENWWSVGETGPCGSDTEMFYDTGKKSCGPNCQPGCNCGKYFEIWNDVFMEFNRKPDGKLEKLKQRNIDTGMGVERTAAMLQGKDDVYQTELFSGLISQIEEISKKKYRGENKELMRIIADHLRAVVFLTADGIKPSGVERGSVLRRLITRIITKEFNLEKNGFGWEKFIKEGYKLGPAVKSIVDFYKPDYDQLKQIPVKGIASIVDKLIYEEIEESYMALQRSNPKILKIILKNNRKIIDGEDAFNFSSTYGIPLEVIEDEARIHGKKIDKIGFQKAFRRHQEKSRVSAKKKFAGGLADRSQEVTKLHTATHLLHQSLRQILGEQVHQVGSNITPERLRFDFTYPEKLTPEEIKQVEDLVNEQIQKDLAVKMEMMSLEEAKKKGALAFFTDKYGSQVKVYSVGDFSCEVCGGPHVGSLGEIGDVKIIKEEAIGTGKRRIYAQINQK